MAAPAPVDPAASPSGDSRLVYVGSQNNGDGTSTMTYRSQLPVDKLTGKALFVRLLVQ